MGQTSSSLAEALAAVRAARAAERQETRSTAERFEAAAHALRDAIRANPADVRLKEALAELHRAEGTTDGRSSNEPAPRATDDERRDETDGR